MATKTGEVPTIQRRQGGARGVINVVYTYLAALFVLGARQTRAR